MLFHEKRGEIDQEIYKDDIEYQTRKIEKLRQQGRNQAVIEFEEPRIVTDNKGNKYKIASGAQIQGKLSAQYQFSYDEIDGLATNFKSIRVVNSLKVQNLSIPLKENDRVIRVQSESESLLNRLFGDFFF